MKLFKKAQIIIVASLIAALCAFSVKMPAYAAGTDVEGLISYASDQSLFTFVKAGELVDVSSFLSDVNSSDIARATTNPLASLKDSGSSVHYILIIDASGSMKKYLSAIDEFVRKLSDSTNTRSFFTLATFGERFDVRKEKMTDINTVLHEIDSFSYNEWYTDPYTAIISADTWLDSYAVTSGDLVELILITDGEPDLKNPDTENDLAVKAKNCIENSWYYIFNTFCTKEWTEKAKETFICGKGVHFLAENNEQAAAAGENVAKELDSVYLSETSLKEKAPASFSYNFVMMLGKDINGNSLGTVGPLTFDNVRNVKAASAGNIPADATPTPVTDPDVTTPTPEPTDEPGDATPTPTDEPGGATPSPTDEPGDTTPAPTDEPGDATPAPSAGSGDDTPSSSSGEDPIGSSSGEEPTDDPDKPGKDRDRESDDSDDKEAASESVFSKIFNEDNLLLLVGIGTGVILLIIVLVTILVVRSNKKKNGGPAPAVAGPGSIPIVLEVFSGRTFNKKNTVYMNGELRIGSSRNCEIAFDDPGIMPVQARVVRSGDEFFIEDLSSPSLIAIGGMRINGRNRLRSGDIITMGMIQFSLKF